MAVCRACGTPNAVLASFCVSCGVPLDAAGEGEERKVVTVLFCDLVEFTARFDRADPEDVRQVLAAYHGRVRREIERFGGAVEKFIGDAVMAVYGAPATREDDALRAVLTALRIPPVIEELNASNRDAPLAVRIGIETGEAIVSVGADHLEALAVGDVVNTASRLQTVAPAGGTIVGETTYRLTRDFVDYEPHDPVEVKGKVGRLPVWVAKGARGRFGADLQRAPSTPLVDREDELEILKRVFALTLRESSIQIVTLVGEAGVGKSRLITEFFAYTDDRPGLVVWRQGRCLPYGESVSFWAFTSIVKAQAGILESDPANVAAAKLAESVAAVVEGRSEQEWVRARLAPLIGLEGSPEGIDRGESFSAWRRYIEGIAATRPLVMAIEDLHWADANLLEFLEHVADWSADVPILILCTARPELFDTNPRWGGGRRNASIVSLAPLNDDEVDRLVSSILRPETSEVERREVVERSGGIPLFAEEFVRMLDDRAAAGDGEPGARPSGRAASPETLHALIAARVDTLAPVQKLLLQDASVVGNVFWPGALVGMGGLDASEVEHAPRELVRRGLIRRSRVSTIEGEHEYTFSHSLVREVVYGQIPRVARARKHVSIARWTEQLAGERLADHAELLAYHYGRALELAKAAGLEDEAQPVEEAAGWYWMLAGERAMTLDIAHAEVCFDEALRLLPAGHADRVRALAGKGEACLNGGKYEDAERFFGESIVESRARGELLRLGSSLDRLATVLWERGDPAWRATLAEAVDVLDRLPPSPELAECFATVASDRLVTTGRFEEAIEWSDRALALAAELDAEWLVPRALGYRGMARVHLGDLSGIEDLDRGIAIAERHGLSRKHAQLLVIKAEDLWAIEGPARALEAVGEGIRFSERRGVYTEAIACRTLGLGPLFDLGRWDEVERETEQVGRAGGEYSRILAEPWRAQVRLWRGEAGGAVPSTSHTLTRALEIGDPQVVVSAVAAAGLVAAWDGRLDEAIAPIEALDRATDVNHSWYREQSLPDLVRICARCRRPDVAQRLLDRSRGPAERHRLGLATAEATLDEALGRHDEAARGYQEAVAGWSAHGHVLESALASLGAGRCLAALGSPAASDHLRRAEEAFRGLGARRLLAELETR